MYVFGYIPKVLWLFGYSPKGLWLFGYSPKGLWLFGYSPKVLWLFGYSPKVLWLFGYDPKVLWVMAFPQVFTERLWISALPKGFVARPFRQWRYQLVLPCSDVPNAVTGWLFYWISFLDFVSAALRRHSADSNAKNDLERAKKGSFTTYTPILPRRTPRHSIRLVSLPWTFVKRDTRRALIILKLAISDRK